MDNLFKDLESLGLDQIEDQDIYKEELPVKKVQKKKSLAHDILYQRSVDCPCCQKSFKVTSIRSGRIRFRDSDLDLRPRYNSFDPIPYDVIVCPHCGYAALNKYFMKASSAKIELVQAKVSKNYRGKEYPMVLIYEDAIERYKLALYCSTIGLDSLGMKAYLCLKISWLYRGWYEELQKVQEEDKEQDEDTAVEAKMKQLQMQELVFTEKAHEGFIKAYEKEAFPIMGIDAISFEFLLAELSRRLGDIDSAKRWLGRVLMHKNISKRMGNKIYEIKELIKEASASS